MIRRRCDWPGAESKFAARDVDEERGDGALLGSDGPAYPLAIAQKELGKFILSRRRTPTSVVVSMGNTWGADACSPVDVRPGTDSRKTARIPTKRPRRRRFRRAHADRIGEDSDGSLGPAYSKTITTCRRRLSERSSRTPRGTPRRASRSRRGSPRWGRRTIVEAESWEPPPSPNRIRTRASSAAPWTRWRRFARSGASWAPR